MAFLGHLGPLWPLQPAGHNPRPTGPLGPFWPKSNEAKRGKGGSSSAHKARWAYLSHFWPQFSPWPLETTSAASRKDSPQVQGKTFPASMLPAIKDPGVVHIWYNIPLCTIFPQQSNFDVFRTKLHDSKSSQQSITNSKGRFFNYSVWQLPGGYHNII
ncbi:hypothetical protein O181_037194 [Austropuccinia psidii MF-1]|uniref:Uncharacterized protein n=1 Tax=Austropuccinia psidii MF-1 TaxID=1389203 RepID=A0A9Q3D5Y5_9BASI|nr:hypothetical protein [Austropuccinia psidii MF-1]